MSGVLYVVATPIGNLDDWSRRAGQVLEAVDLLLAEDTRHTQRLLARYGIRVPLRSYHDFNEEHRALEVVGRLEAGLNAALVSDQGTPCISDPGYRIVRVCRQRGVTVIPIPGPNAAITALSVSGLPTDEFHFVGFLPARKDARRRRLEDLKQRAGTLVLYEAPQRVQSCLDDLIEILGDRTMFMAREMTKVHEEYLFGPISEVRAQVKTKGEFVLVVDGTTGREPSEPPPNLEEVPRQELLKLIARRLGVNRRALYDALYKK